MQWSIPALLLVAALTFLRLAFAADDPLVGWIRLIVAVFFLCIAAVYALALGVNMAQG